MPFTVITLGDFLDQLSERLDDPANSFFSRAEVLAYATEALRTWAAHTGYWTRRAEFLTTPGVKDYDLTNLAKYNLGSGDIYPAQLTVTDREQITQLCYHLLEPPILTWASGWAGTEQFSLELLRDATQLGVNGQQLLNGLIGQAGSQVVAPAPINQYDFPGDYINLRTLYWQSVEGIQTPLSRQNQYLRSLFVDRGTTPNSYSTIGVLNRKVELSPAPTDTGTLVYIYNPGHNSLLPTAAPTTLYAPTNFAWAAKWHSLFTLLNADGERRDKFRADYCMMRIKDSQVVARHLPLILRAFIDGEEVGVDAAWDANSQDPNWRNQSGKPDHIVLHAWNIISLSKIPAITTDNPTGEFSISFDLAANAPVPSSESEYLDLSNDLIQVLLDYSHHLACFKMGGQEFAESIPSYERFLRAAMQYNGKLSAESNQFMLLKEKSTNQRRRKPISTSEDDQ